MLFAERVDSERHRLDFSADRPFVYLDHGGLVALAQDEALSTRFAMALRGHGCLMLSIVNMLELSKKDPGPSSDRVAALLGALDDRVAFVTTTPSEKGQPPELFDFSEARLYFKFLGYPSGRIPMNRLVEFAQRADIAGVAREKTANYDQNLLLLFATARSNARSGAKRAPAKLLREEFTAEELTSGELLDLAARHECRLGPNDMRDYAHAVAGLTFCDFVVLDAKWANLGRTVVRRGRSRATVFSISEIQRMVERFEESAANVPTVR